MPGTFRKWKERLSSKNDRNSTTVTQVKTAAASTQLNTPGTVASPSGAAPGPPGTALQISNSGGNASTQDLWGEAVALLSAKEQKAVHSIQISVTPSARSSNDLLAQLQASVTAKQTECEENRWKFTFRSRELILRDVAGKVLVWLNKFKDIGDVVAQYDPVHLALPWAGVRLLLQCAVQESQQVGAMLLGMEAIARVVSQCRLLELLYLKPSNQNEASLILQMTLVKTYSQILQFLAAAHDFYTQKFVTRTLQAIFDPMLLSDFIEKVTSSEEALHKQSQLCESMQSRTHQRNITDVAQQLRTMLLSIDQPLIRTDERVAHLWELSNALEASKILQWISDVPYKDNHKTAREGYVATTGTWLLDHERYRDWRTRSSSTVLWLHGIPGAGKTKLVTTVIEDLTAALSGSLANEGFAYFYCSRNEDARSQPLSILRTLVKQLTASHDNSLLQKSLVKIYRDKHASGFASKDLSEDECRHLLEECVENYPQTTIVLDALDECDPRTRGKLVDFFDKLVTYAGKPVKIFLSSRPDDDIKYRFETGPNIGILATDNQNDIAAFVAKRIEAFGHGRRNSLSDELRRKIISTLLEKSQGMFQWASLQIDQLLALRLEEDIRNRLGRLPMDLKAAYDELYDEIRCRGGKEKTIAMRAFSWVLQSNILLSPKRLLAAISQDPDSTDPTSITTDMDTVLDLCRNLLIVDRQLDVCRFSHLSVREYLEEYRKVDLQADLLIARVCLRVLLVEDKADENVRSHGPLDHSSLDDDWGGGLDLQGTGARSGPGGITDILVNIYRKPPLNFLQSYAIFNWPRHVRGCENFKGTQHLTELLMAFLGSPDKGSPKFDQWCDLSFGAGIADISHDEAADVREAIRQYRKPITAMCCLGLNNLLSTWWKAVLEDFHKYRTRCIFLLTCTILANDMELFDRLLVKSGEHSPRLYDYCSPMSEAIRLGRTTAVKRLLSHGVDIDMGNSLPVVYAATEGRYELLQLLLHNGATADPAKDRDSTALVAASRAQHKRMCLLLLKFGADIDRGSSNSGTPLVAVASAGLEDMTQFLIEYGANINYSTPGHITPLMGATIWRRPRIVEILLRKGVDVNRQAAAITLH